MPGTLLSDDLQSSIEDQLHQHINNLLNQAQSAGQQAVSAVVQPVQAIGQGVVQAPQAIQTAVTQPLQQAQQRVQDALNAHIDQLGQQAAQAQQGAVQVLGGAQQAAGQTQQDVQSALNQHIDSLTGAAQGALQSLAPPVTSQAPAQQPLGTTPAAQVLGAPTGTDQTTTPDQTAAPAPDRSQSLQDYARAAARRAGIDPNIFQAQIQQESGFNPDAKSPAGAVGIAQFMPDTAKGMGVDPTDPYAALDAAARLDAQNLAKYNGDYRKTLAAYNAGGGAVDQYGGVPPFQETQHYVDTIMSAQAQRAGQLPTADISQFGDPQLTAAEASAACGPAAAVRFAERFGRNPTLREATDLAAQVGWNQQQGMAGLSSEKALMDKLGIDTKLVGRDWGNIAMEASTGNPVTISTADHYFTADGYNQQNGTFHVGRSGMDLRGGSEWMTPVQMETLMGPLQGALFSNNPNVPSKGAATSSPTTLGGEPSLTAPINVAGPQVRQPLYVHDAMQPAAGALNAPPTPIQAAGEALGGVIQQGKQAVQQVLQDLGSAAEELNRQTPGRGAVEAVQPILGGVQAAVGQAAGDVGTAAQQLNQQTPGRGAVQAVQATAPVLGGVASDIGTRARQLQSDITAPILGAYGLDKTPEQREADRQQYQQDVLNAAQQYNQAQVTPQNVAASAFSTFVGDNPSQGITLAQYQAAQAAKNQWLEDNNPVRDTPLVGGLTTGIAQMLTDPLMLATLGPTMELGGALGAAARAGTAARLGDRLAPQAVRFASDVADRLVSGGFVNGVQSALSEASRPNASPQSVGQAFLAGAALGGAIDAGSPVVARLGARILAQAPGIGEVLQARQAGGGYPFGEPTPPEPLEPGTPRVESVAPAETPPTPSTPPAREAFAAPETTPAAPRGLPETAGAAPGPERGRLVPEAVAAPTATEGFRAPEAESVRPGADVLRASATGGEPPTGPIGREPIGEGPVVRNLSDVHSNPFLLREAAAGETPMSVDERLSHQDMLEQRYQANQNRLGAIDELLNNPGQKVERPPWAAGYTNDQVAQMARSVDASAFEPLWWEKAGLNTGSGEVQRLLTESGFQRNVGGIGAQPEPTLADLRRERNTLAQEQRDLVAAGEQQATAPDNASFVRQADRPRELPFSGAEEAHPTGPFATETAGPSTLAEDLVTRNGTKDYGAPLRDGPGEVVATGRSSGRQVGGEVTGRGVYNADETPLGVPTEATTFRMPNLDAMLKGEMPEVRAQVQKAAEDNPALFDAYQQGRISHDSLLNDLATKVGMTKADFLKTPVGKGFSTPELVALQAAAIDGQAQSEQLARDIAARGGVNALTSEEVAHGVRTLLDNARLLAVARGGRASAGRSLNALKARMDATMAQGITAANDRVAALRAKADAQRAVTRANTALDNAKALDQERVQAVSSARQNGASRNILQQIDDAYAQLDRYQAMSLHEKADDWAALQKERAAAAANRKEKVRTAPEELLKALQDELKAERDNFAKRKDTWETMAFWDSKANENAIAKRNAFRGGLYIEQFRKAAELAAKTAEDNARRAFDLEARRRNLQNKKATTLLESIGGQTPSRELLQSYVEAVNSDDPLAAAKFVKGLQDPGWWGRSQILRIAGLLSSTATHAVNMTGNVVNAALEIPTHALTVGIDAARAGITGGERQAYKAELGPMAGAWGGGFLSKFPDAIRILQTGVSPQDAIELGRGRVGRAGFGSGNRAVDATAEMPLRLLQAEDELFRGGGMAMQANRVATNYAYGEGFRGRQLAGRTADIIANLESYPDLYKQAYDATLRMLYQERRTVPVPMAMGTGQGAEIARGAVSQILPFVKTPANITAQGFGMSPIGLASVAEGLMNRRNLRPEQLGQQTLLTEQRLARAMIGSAIFGGFYALGMGALSGGKSALTGAYDPNEASTYPQGYREWSYVAQDPVSGNTYYIPFQNFGAAGVPMALAAIMTDAHRHGQDLLNDQQSQVQASTAIGQYILDNTFLQGLSDTVNVLHDPSRYAPNFVQGLVASYGPYSAMGRQVQRAMGVASRNPREGWQGLVDALEANYPGLSANVPEATTAIGEPRTQGISGAASFILPVRADIARDDPTLQALRDADVQIPAAAKAVNVGNGYSINLTEDEQDQLKRARGEEIRVQVDRVLNSDVYRRHAGDIGAQNQLLRQAVSNAAQNSDIRFVRSLSRTDIQDRAVKSTVPTPYTLAGVA